MRDLLDDDQGLFVVLVIRIHLFGGAVLARFHHVVVPISPCTLFVSFLSQHPTAYLSGAFSLWLRLRRHKHGICLSVENKVW